jgi:TP901 family phage tail tape measure protein
MKEYGVRLKVGVEGQDNAERLGKALRELGVNTSELDQAADKLGTGLQGATKSTDTLAGAGADLAAVQGRVAKETALAAAATGDNARGVQELGTQTKSATQILGDMKLELAAAGAAVYTAQRLLGDAATAAAQFGKGMAEVSTLLDDTSGMAQLTEDVRALTREFGGQAPEQARALYQIISAGTSDAAKATEMLATANRLAIGGVTDVATAADGLTSIMNAYGGAAGGAAQVSDALFVAMKAGKTTVGELSSSIGQTAPIASQAGVSLEELLSAVSALTKGGVGTGEAMTQVRAAISSIIKPSAEAQELAGALGLSFDAQALKAKGLAGFLDDVRKATGGNTEVMAQLFGSVEALGAVLSLTGAQSKDFNGILQSMQERAGATDDAFAKMADTPAFAAQRMKAAMADMQIALGNAVTALTPVVESVTGAVNAFNNLPEPVKNTTAAIAGVAIAAAPVALALTAVQKAVRLAVDGLAGLRLASVALAAPATAAAAGVGAVGLAAAGATPAIGGAAAAVGLLGRALGFVKGALLPLTVVAGLAVEFFRVKQQAEAADEQVRQMLQGPGKAELTGTVQDSRKAIEEAGKASEAAAVSIEGQGAAALIAAKRLGVDMAKASKAVSLEFQQNEKDLQAVIDGVDLLAKKGFDTGQVVQQSLEKMISGARNQAELDRLRERLEALGKAGLLSGRQVEDMLGTIRAKAEEAQLGVNGLQEAYKQLGIKSQTDLEKIAAANKQAWELIRRDATATLDVKQAAFKRYAESAIAANDGVADSTFKAEAASLGLAVQADKTGKVIVLSLGKAVSALDELRGRYEAALELERRRNGLTGGQPADSTLGQGPASLGTNNSSFTLAPFQSGNGASPQTSVQFQPPDGSGNWVFDSEGFNRAHSSPTSKLSPPDPSRFWRYTGPPTPGAFAGPGTNYGALPAPAPAPGPTPSQIRDSTANANAGTAGLTAVQANMVAAGAPVLGRYEVSLTNPRTGVRTSTFNDTAAQAQAFADNLQAALSAAAGG